MTLGSRIQVAKGQDMPDTEAAEMGSSDLRISGHPER